MSTAIAEITTPVSIPYDEFESLTLKQKAFADNYIEHRNGRLAAKLAGYDGSDEVLRTIASQNLTKPNIADYIRKKLIERHLSPEHVLAELGDIGAYALDSIAAEGAPVKTQDKLKALELIGKYHKLFTDRTETDISEASVSKLTESFLSALQAAVAQRQQALDTAAADTNGPQSLTVDY